MADPTLLTDLPDQRAVFRRAVPFLAGHRLALAVTLLLNLAGAAAAVGVTAAIGRVVDAAGGGDRPGLLRRVLLLLLLVMRQRGPHLALPLLADQDGRTRARRTP